MATPEGQPPPGTSDPAQAPARAPEDVSGPVYENQAIRITDLAVTEPLIRDAHFKNCVIHGPAVLAPLSGTQFIESTFEGDLEAVLWEIAPGRENIIGGIGLVNCLFVHCRFSGIGLAGPPEAIAQFRENVRMAEAVSV